MPKKEAEKFSLSPYCNSRANELKTGHNKIEQVLLHINEATHDKLYYATLLEAYCQWLQAASAWGLKTNDLVGHYIVGNFFLALKEFQPKNKAISELVKREINNKQQARFEELEQSKKKLKKISKVLIGNSTAIPTDVSKQFKIKQAKTLVKQAKIRLQLIEYKQLEHAIIDLEKARPLLKNEGTELVKCLIALIQARILSWTYETNPSEQQKQAPKIKALFNTLGLEHKAINSREPFKTISRYANEIIKPPPLLFENIRPFTASCLNLLETLQEYQIPTLLSYQPIVNTKRSETEIAAYKKTLQNLENEENSALINNLLCRFKKAWLYAQIGKIDQSIKALHAIRSEIKTLIANQRIHLSFYEIILTKIVLVINLWLMDMDEKNRDTIAREAVTFFNNRARPYLNNIMLSSEIKQYRLANHNLLQIIQHTETKQLENEITNVREIIATAEEKYNLEAITNSLKTINTTRVDKTEKVSLLNVLFISKKQLQVAARLIAIDIFNTPILEHANMLTNTEQENNYLSINHRINLLEILLFVLTHIEPSIIKPDEISKLITSIDINFMALLRDIINKPDFTKNQAKLQQTLEYLNPTRQLWHHHNQEITNLYKKLYLAWQKGALSTDCTTNKKQTSLNTKTAITTPQDTKDKQEITNSIFSNFGTTIEHMTFYIDTIIKDTTLLQHYFISTRNDLIYQYKRAEESNNLILLETISYILCELENTPYAQTLPSESKSNFHLQKQRKLAILKKSSEEQKKLFEINDTAAQSKQTGCSESFLKNPEYRELTTIMIDANWQIQSGEASELACIINNSNRGIVFFEKKQKDIKQSLTYQKRRQKKSQFNKADLEYCTCYITYLQLLSLQARLVYLLHHANTKGYQFELTKYTALKKLFKKLNQSKHKDKEEKRITATIEALLKTLDHAKDQSLLHKHFNFFSTNVLLIDIVRLYFIHEILNYNAVIPKENNKINKPEVNEEASEITILLIKSIIHKPQHSLLEGIFWKCRIAWLQIQAGIGSLEEILIILVPQAVMAGLIAPQSAQIIANQIKQLTASSTEGLIQSIITDAEKVLSKNYFSFTNHKALLIRIILISHLWLAEIHKNSGKEEECNNVIMAAIRFFNASCKKYTHQPSLLLEIEYHAPAGKNHPLFEVIRTCSLSPTEEPIQTKPANKNTSSSNTHKNRLRTKKRNKKNKRKTVTTFQAITKGSNQTTTISYTTEDRETKENKTYAQTIVEEAKKTRLEQQKTAREKARRRTKAKRAERARKRTEKNNERQKKNDLQECLPAVATMENNQQKTPTPESSSENNDNPRQPAQPTNTSTILFSSYQQALQKKKLNRKERSRSASERSQQSDGGSSTSSDDYKSISSVSSTTSSPKNSRSAPEPPTSPLALTPRTELINSPPNLNPNKLLRQGAWQVLAAHKISFPKIVMDAANLLADYCSKESMPLPEFIGGCHRSPNPRDYDLNIRFPKHTENENSTLKKLSKFLKEKMHTKKCDHINNLFQSRKFIGITLIKIDIKISYGPLKQPDFLINTFRAKRNQNGIWHLYSPPYFKTANEALSYLNGKVLEIPGGNQSNHFPESPIRILRGLRFCAEEGYQFSKKVEQLIRSQRICLMNFPSKDFNPERILSELRKLTNAAQVKAVNLLYQLDLLQCLFPGLIYKQEELKRINIALQLSPESGTKLLEKIDSTRHSNDKISPSQTILNKINSARTLHPKLTIAELYQLYKVGAWSALEKTNFIMHSNPVANQTVSQKPLFYGDSFAILDALAICLKHNLRLPYPKNSHNGLDKFIRAQLPIAAFTTTSINKNWGRVKHFLKALLLNKKIQLDFDALTEDRGILSRFFPGACKQIKRQAGVYGNFMKEQLKIASGSYEAKEHQQTKQLSIGSLIAYLFAGEILNLSIEYPALLTNLSYKAWETQCIQTRIILKNMQLLEKFGNYHIGEMLKLLDRIKPTTSTKTVQRQQIAYLNNQRLLINSPNAGTTSLPQATNRSQQVKSKALHQ